MARNKISIKPGTAQETEMNNEPNVCAPVDRRVRQQTSDEVRSAINIVEHMFSLGGPDLRHLSDAELVAHMKRVSKRIADNFSKLGVSAAEAAQALDRMST